MVNDIIGVKVLNEDPQIGDLLVQPVESLSLAKEISYETMKAQIKLDV